MTTYFKATSEGNVAMTQQEIDELEASRVPRIVIPDQVTMRQARLALFAAGKLASVATVINSLPSPQKEAAQIEWEYSSDVRRQQPLVLQLAPALGLDSAALDALFIDAATR